MVHRRLPTAAISHSRFTAPHQPTFCTCMNSYSKLRRTTVTWISVLHVLQGIKPISSDVGAHKRLYHQPTRETKPLTYLLRLPRYLNRHVLYQKHRHSGSSHSLANSYGSKVKCLPVSHETTTRLAGYAFIPHTALPTHSSTTSPKDDL